MTPAMQIFVCIYIITLIFYSTYHYTRNHYSICIPVDFITTPAMQIFVCAYVIILILYSIYHYSINYSIYIMEDFVYM